MPPVRGSVVFLFDAGGRILLQQRDDDIPPAGYGRWAVPGGGAEGDESPRETALREFEEETGVRLERMRHFATDTYTDGPTQQLRVTDLFYADDEVAEEVVVVGEGLAFKYWSPEETSELPMNPLTRERFERFIASDKYRGTVESNADYRTGVSVIEIDRWGRVLLQLRDADLPADRFPDTWAIPGGLIHPGEAPDAAAFREFEEETGQTLISGMGELHLEVIVDRMRREFRVAANIGRPQVAYRETITRAATAEGRFVRQTGGRGQYGVCELEI